MHRASPPKPLTLTLCTVLLAIFATLAWTSVFAKSPTWDEVDHAPAGWTHLHLHDYRLDCENPILWKLWAALPNSYHSITADFQSPLWIHQPQQSRLEWEWAVQTLFRTPGNNAEKFIARSRAMMLILGIALGVLIACFTWKLKSPLAALIATAFFCLDPNFLAHSALVKNDVAFSLSLLGLIYCLWRAGDRLTWRRAIALGCLGGIMLTVKFTGLLAAIILPTLLILRAFFPTPWIALGKIRASRFDKFLAALITSIISAGVAVLLIWAVYGFRFAPTPDPSIRLNIQSLADAAKWNDLLYNNGTVTAQQLAAAPSALLVRCILFANDHRLLPHAWLAGLLFQYRSTLIHKTFFLGQTGYATSWDYFPLAMAVKTPITTILAILVSCIIACITIRRMSWSMLCVIVSVLIYLAFALRSHLHTGLRHVLPIYPFVFIAIGCAADLAIKRWNRRAISAICLLLICLAIETLSAFPNYIAFFNRAAGGSTGGFHLLGDSNLDWGQDLKLLADWQQQNPSTTLYLSYFGTADPHYYNIRYIPLKGGYQYDTNRTLPTTPGTLAISVSILQGLSHDPQVVPAFQNFLLQLKPFSNLGGSIYLYHWPPQSADLQQTNSTSN